MLACTVYGKTFAVVHKTHHSLENFRGASGPCHYMYCTQQIIQGENFRDWLKTAKVFPLESFAVYGNLFGPMQQKITGFITNQPS